MQVGALRRVLLGEERALSEVNFIKKELLTSFTLGFLKLSQQFMPLPIKLILYVWWFDLFLANDFPFDSMLLIKPP